MVYTMYTETYYKVYSNQGVNTRHLKQVKQYQAFIMLIRERLNIAITSRV
jgi:hypothetical protein